MNSFRYIASAVVLAAAPSLAGPAWAHPPMGADDPSASLAGVPAAYEPRLRDWPVAAGAFAAARVTQAGARLKAASDLATVFRPLPPCRLFDTRGFPAAIAVPGPFAANSTTNINAAGNCGIPDNGYVGGLSVAITVQNLTVNSGGYISTQQQGEPVTATNAVLNFGTEWTPTTANIPIPNGSGDFSVFLALATAHVIIDVNGYYQSLDNLDTGNQEMDISGATLGDLLNVTNSSIGPAVRAANSGAGPALVASTVGGTAITTLAGPTGTALRVSSGAIAVSGAGIGSNTAVSIHQVNTAGAFGAGGTLCDLGFSAYTVIDHPMLNGDPNAIVFVTPRYNGGSATNSAVEAYYYMGGGCAAAAANHWMIRRADGNAHLNNSTFSLMIVKP